MRSKGTLRSDTKIEKLAQMRSNAEQQLLVPSVAWERLFFGQEVWNRKYKVSFCPQIAEHFYQPELFNGSRILHIL